MCFEPQLACLHDLDCIPKSQDFCYFVDIEQKFVELVDKLAVSVHQEVVAFEALQLADYIAVAIIVAVEAIVVFVVDSKQHQLFELPEYLFVVAELVVMYLKTALLFEKTDQP
jgi:hypothetical protein